MVLKMENSKAALTDIRNYKIKSMKARGIKQQANFTNKFTKIQDTKQE